MQENIFQVEANIPKARYFNEQYFKRKQFESLVSQLVEVVKLTPINVLEIGVGNGFVSSFLKSSGIKVTTFDINRNLNPDVIGNVIEIDKYFQPNSFDLILCAEVLEHIPFEYFELSLKKISIISSANVLITLPRRHRILLDLRLFFKIPFIKQIVINIFYRIPDRHKWEGHYWEIDYKPEFSLSNISKLISKHFLIKANYVNEIVRHHQFFILEIFN